MPHKMTITGKPTSTLRPIGKCLSFDMEEGGSPSAPKGLPKSSVITYTIFVNQKQLNKAEITEENFQSSKIMVQGEPTLDASVDECPGEIGLVCFQISIIPEKSKKEPQKQKVSIEEKKETTQETKPVEEKREKQPDGTEDVVLPQDIIILEEFLQFTPNPFKTQKVIDYVNKNGHLDEPIEIEKGTNVLKDGYRRYLLSIKKQPFPPNKKKSHSDEIRLAFL